jgi:hypothetical protein
VLLRLVAINLSKLSSFVSSMSFLSFGATPALFTRTWSLPKCFFTCSIIFFLSPVNETSPWQYKTSAPALRNSCKASATAFSSLTPFTARSKPF